jgi:hypothetical protein
MELLRFEIRHADGRTETTTAHAPRVVIGSGAHCDVRLAADQAAFAHVTIESDPSGPIIRCLSPVPAALLDGAPFTGQALSAVAVLRISGTEVKITRAALTAVAPRSSVNPAMLAKVLVIALLGVAIVALLRKNTEQEFGAPPKAPSLFGATSKECTTKEPTEARVLAEDQRAIADGARERSPFDPREVRSAVRSYELASACYLIAQRPADSDDAAQSAQRLREDSQLDFRARRIRLERMLLVNDYEVASQDVAVLRALTEGGPANEYSRWLASVALDIKNHKAEVK